MVTLSYFSSPSTQSNVNSDQFSKLGGASEGFNTHSIQFSVPYPYFWIMISVDDKSKTIELDRLTVTATSCAEVRLL